MKLPSAEKRGRCRTCQEHYRICTVAPCWLLLPSTDSRMRAAPAGVPSGTRTLTWYTPIWPGAAPANDTVAERPPMLAVTGRVVVESVVSDTGVPWGTGGVSGPRPVA